MIFLFNYGFSMKLLILTQSYPTSDSPYAMSYVHTRNLAYKNLGCNLIVVNFSALKEYEFDGIRVVSPASVDFNVECYDLIISHAPNLRNHIRFLNKFSNVVICFFFHGHEVLRVIKDYPPPYAWRTQAKLYFFSSLSMNLYDSFKLFFLRIWFARKNKKNKVGMVFVSDWMREQFEKNIKVSVLDVCKKYAIIHNAVGDAFEKNKFDFECEKIADFVTIRPLDDSKYAIDLILEFAVKNPNKKFHIYGRGDYFCFNSMPDNVQVFNFFLLQKNIPSLLDLYHYAIMPTRYDSQGVMVCEMACYGIPVITSDINIMREVLSGFPNVMYVPLDGFSFLFEDVQCFTSELPSKLNSNRFSSAKLASEEIKFMRTL